MSDYTAEEIARRLETAVPNNAELVIAARMLRDLGRANNEKAIAMERLAEQVVDLRLAATEGV